MNRGESADNVHAWWEEEFFRAGIQRTGHGAGGLDDGREWGGRAEGLILYCHNGFAVSWIKFEKAYYLAQDLRRRQGTA